MTGDVIVLAILVSALLAVEVTRLAMEVGDARRRKELDPGADVGLAGTPATVAAINRCTVLKRTPTGELVEWHRCEVGSDDYHEALRTPGLYVRKPDGTVVEGDQ